MEETFLSKLDQIEFDVKSIKSTFDQIKDHLGFLKKIKAGAGENLHHSERINELISYVEKILVFRAKREAKSKEVNLDRLKHLYEVLNEHSLICEEFRSEASFILQKIFEIEAPWTDLPLVFEQVI